ncbi:hypothetical protein HDV01_005709 [Terramyces sp. JEL0728]|nr:hypothetical protein HDV01_005709 [Terramyces sp. JEL0728]
MLLDSDDANKNLENSNINQKLTDSKVFDLPSTKKLPKLANKPKDREHGPDSNQRLSDLKHTPDIEPFDNKAQITSNTREFQNRRIGDLTNPGPRAPVRLPPIHSLYNQHQIPYYSYDRRYQPYYPQHSRRWSSNPHLPPKYYGQPPNWNNGQ